MNERTLLADLPPVLTAVLGFLPVSVLLRLLWHRRLVRLGHRHFWSTDLLWELPTAVACAVIGGGVTEYYDLTGVAAHAVVGAVAWMGPRGLEIALSSWLPQAWRHLHPPVPPSGPES